MTNTIKGHTCKQIHFCFQVKTLSTPGTIATLKYLV